MDSNGRLLKITYEPVWMPAHIMGEKIALIKVRRIYPMASPLPISKTGFYTNTLPTAARCRRSLADLLHPKASRRRLPTPVRRENRLQPLGVVHVHIAACP
jgi:hypothetical protein